LSPPTARFDGLAELHREDPGEDAIVKGLLHRKVAGAWSAPPRELQPRAHDQLVVAQRVQMKSNGRHVQAGLRGKLGGVHRSVVLAHQLEYTFALTAISSSSACSCVGFVIHV
jgi:hypothetical protein